MTEYSTPFLLYQKHAIIMGTKKKYWYTIKILFVRQMKEMKKIKIVSMTSINSLWAFFSAI